MGKQAAFKTNPINLEELLRHCGSGKIQLPDFQRSWVWDEERIKGLVASISQAFPVGALMTLEVKPGAADTFARRPIQGAEAVAANAALDQFLLDGQQRMTSLYQTCLRREVVQTVTPRLKLVKRWFYIDIRKAMNPAENRENAIVSVPEDRRIKSDFDRKIDLDLSTPELEYQNLMFPLNQVFDWDEWQDGFNEYWLEKDPETRKLFKPFKDEVLQNFKAYQLPVIALGPDTSHEAVCLVFEKVNTGGKPLDAFELVTAMYAARGHRLRDDWLGADGQPGLQTRLQLYGRAAEQKFGVLEKVAATDVLQAIALLHGAKKREAEIATGRKESELSAVRATRQSLLDLPLDAYLKHRGAVEEGFKTAARFLRQNHIYRVIDLPYQGQLVPFAAILAIIGPKFDHAAVRDRLARWFWCGIFGELYGSAIESRFAKDVLEVPAWLDDGPGAQHHHRWPFPARTAAHPAHAPLGRLQGYPRPAHSRGRDRLPLGPALRPDRVFRRICRYPPHLSAGLVQEAEDRAEGFRHRHQQDAAQLQDEPHPRQGLALGQSVPARGGGQGRAAHRARCAGRIPHQPRDGSRTSTRRRFRGLHGGSRKPSSGHDRAGDGPSDSSRAGGARGRRGRAAGRRRVRPART